MVDFFVFPCDATSLMSLNLILVIGQPRAEERGQHTKPLERKKEAERTKYRSLGDMPVAYMNAMGTLCYGHCLKEGKGGSSLAIAQHFRCRHGQ